MEMRCCETDFGQRALFLGTAMTTQVRSRDRLAPSKLQVQQRKMASNLQEPGAFQHALLRALQLRRNYREVFLLKEIQGHSLAEIAAILGISLQTAQTRLTLAHREISLEGQLGV